MFGIKLNRIFILVLFISSVGCQSKAQDTCGQGDHGVGPDFAVETNICGPCPKNKVDKIVVIHLRHILAGLAKGNIRTAGAPNSWTNVYSAEPGPTGDDEKPGTEVSAPLPKSNSEDYNNWDTPLDIDLSSMWKEFDDSIVIKVVIDDPMIEFIHPRNQDKSSRFAVFVPKNDRKSFCQLEKLESSDPTAKRVRYNILKFHTLYIHRDKSQFSGFNIGLLISYPRRYHNKGVKYTRRKMPIYIDPKEMNHG